MKNVFVITNPELGWDCVCGVYENRDDAEKYCAERDKVDQETWKNNEKLIGDSMWIIHETTLE